MERHILTVEVSSGELSFSLDCQSSSSADCLNWCSERCSEYPDCGEDNDNCGCEEGCSDYGCKGVDRFGDTSGETILTWFQGHSWGLPHQGEIRFLDSDYDYWDYTDSAAAPSSRHAIPAKVPDDGRDPISLSEYLASK
jgi:hypothetical protein